jgi:hypothetical protein
MRISLLCLLAIVVGGCSGDKMKPAADGGGGSGGPKTRIALQNATATFSQADFSVGQAIDDSLVTVNGWAIYEADVATVGGLVPGKTHAQTAVFETVSDACRPNADLTITLHQLFSQAGHTLGRFRLSVTSDARTGFADGLATGGDVTASWTVIDPFDASSTDGSTLTVLFDGSILAEGGSGPGQAVYTHVGLCPFGGVTGIRLEVLEDDSLPDSGPGRFENGNFVLTEIQIDVG